MKRRAFTRTVGGIAGLIASGVGVAAAHSPGESDDDNAGNACHSDGSGNKEGREDEGEARESKNPECEG